MNFDLQYREGLVSANIFHDGIVYFANIETNIDVCTKSLLNQDSWSHAINNKMLSFLHDGVVEYICPLFVKPLDIQNTIVNKKINTIEEKLSMIDKCLNREQAIAYDRMSINDVLYVNMATKHLEITSKYLGKAFYPSLHPTLMAMIHLEKITIYRYYLSLFNLPSMILYPIKTLEIIYSDDVNLYPHATTAHSLKYVENIIFPNGFNSEDMTIIDSLPMLRHIAIKSDERFNFRDKYEVTYL